MFRTRDGRNHAFTFALVSSLFLLWGLCNGLIDVLNKHFQNSLEVTKAQSAFVQFANYMGYFLMAIPAGRLARRFGYKAAIVTGLGLIAVGAFWFIPATRIGTFGAFLTGLFILATGLTCLETVANPYTTVLGPPEYGAARINLAQSCNGVGWILGPLIGGQFVLSATGEINRSNETLYLPYLGIGIVVVVLALLFSRAEMPDLVGEDDGGGAQAGPARSIWSHPHFVLAVVAQFFYVAAQTGIFSFFINYIVADMPVLGAEAASALPAAWTHETPEGRRITERAASQLLSFGGFGLFLAGRFIGAALLRRFRAHAMLSAFALVNVVVTAVVMLPAGWASVAALFATFFFMSIMFPTIFALGIDGLGAEAKRAAAYIVMAIVGGAVMPLVMGAMADRWSMRAGFGVPLVCFVVVLGYAAAWPRLRHRSTPSGLLRS